MNNRINNKELKEIIENTTPGIPLLTIITLESGNNPFVGIGIKSPMSKEAIIGLLDMAVKQLKEGGENIVKGSIKDKKFKIKVE